MLATNSCGLNQFHFSSAALFDSRSSRVFGMPSQAMSVCVFESELKIAWVVRFIVAARIQTNKYVAPFVA